MKTVLCLLLLLSVGGNPMCGGSGNNSYGGGGNNSYGDDGRDSLAGTSGNMGQSVASPSGVDKTTTGYNGGSLGGDGGNGQGLSSGSGGGQVSGDQVVGGARVTDTKKAEIANFGRARATLEAYSTTKILGNVGLTDDEGLTLGGEVTPAGTLQSSVKDAKMTDEETFGEALSRKAKNPFDSSSLGIAGTVVGSALGIPGVGIVGEIVDAAINRKDINLTGLGGRYHWDSKAYLRSNNEDKKNASDNGQLLPVVSPVVEESEAVTEEETSSSTDRLRAGYSTIFTSIFGDIEDARILQPKLGGK